MLLAGLAVASQFVGRQARRNESVGAFPGAPVRIQSPGSEAASATVTLNLTRGACVIQVFKNSTKLPGSTYIRQGTYKRDLAVGDSILLVPEADAAGQYSIRIGDDPFVALRQWMLGLCVVGIAIVALRVSPSGGGPDRWRLLHLLSAFFLSAQAVGIVHEYSHALVGTLMGGEVERVIWTNLMGEQMRVIFRSLPPSAAPWMSAAAIVVPTLLGTALMLWWYRSGCTMARGVSLGLFALGVSLLTNNLILVFDPGHMLALLEHFGMTGAAAQTLSRGPALLSAGLILYIVVRRRGMLTGLWTRERSSAATAA